MNKIISLFLISSLSLCNAYAQIVNVESLRQISDTSKWSGSTSFDIGLIKNTKSIFRITI